MTLRKNEWHCEEMNDPDWDAQIHPSLNSYVRFPGWEWLFLLLQELRDPALHET